jgi:hypothetical protein
MHCLNSWPTYLHVVYDFYVSIVTYMYMYVLSSEWKDIHVHVCIVFRMEIHTCTCMVNFRLDGAMTMIVYFMPRFSDA